MSDSLIDGFFLGEGLPVRQSTIVVADVRTAFARIREHYADCLPEVDSAKALGYSFPTWRFLLETGFGQLQLSIQFVSDEADLAYRRMVLSYIMTDPRASSVVANGTASASPAIVPVTSPAIEATLDGSSAGKTSVQNSSLSWLGRAISSARPIRSPLFIVTVILPTIIASLYYVLIASDIYISESKFILRVPQRTAPSGLEALFQGISFSKTNEDTSVVQEYVKSRDALVMLERKMPALRSAFGPEHADVFSRFPGMLDEGDSFEHMYRYFERHISVDTSASSAVTTLRVQAFSGKDAYLINKYLLEMAEELVNELNDRSRQDMLRRAASEVASAEERVKAAATKLSEFRQRASVFDPERQSNIQLQLIAKLQDELIARKALLSQLRLVSPKSPQVPSVMAAISDLEAAIENENGKITGQRNSLSNYSGNYERLVLERTFAEKLLGSALTSLEQAREDAQRKQIYLERVAEPGEPDIALEPKRLRNVFACFVLGLVTWGILSMLLAGIREHLD